MISRALEKQILDFVALLESQLARLIHTGHQKTKHMPKSVRDNVLRNALIVAWRRREQIDPLNEPVAVWFERCLYVAKFESVIPNDDELVMLKFLNPTPTVVEPLATSSSYEGDESTAAAPGSDATQKIGKDCPPCWRCKYHQGWTPKRWPYAENYQPATEIDAICYELDQRKVKIAEYVQSAYDPRLLED